MRNEANLGLGWGSVIENIGVALARAKGLERCLAKRTQFREQVVEGKGLPGSKAKPFSSVRTVGLGLLLVDHMKKGGTRIIPEPPTSHHSRWRMHLAYLDDRSLNNYTI